MIGIDCLSEICGTVADTDLLRKLLSLQSWQLSIYPFITFMHLRRSAQEAWPAQPCSTQD